MRNVRKVCGGRDTRAIARRERRAHGEAMRSKLDQAHEMQGTCGEYHYQDEHGQTLAVASYRATNIVGGTVPAIPSQCHGIARKRQRYENRAASGWEQPARDERHVQKQEQATSRRRRQQQQRTPWSTCSPEVLFAQHVASHSSSVDLCKPFRSLLRKVEFLGGGVERGDIGRQRREGLASVAGHAKCGREAQGPAKRRPMRKDPGDFGRARGVMMRKRRLSRRTNALLSDAWRSCSRCEPHIRCSVP